MAAVTAVLAGASVLSAGIGMVQSSQANAMAKENSPK